MALTTAQQMATVHLPDVEVAAVCHDCRKKHVYRVQRDHLAQAMAEWTTKHAGHPIEFGSPRPLYRGRWSRWLHEFWNECPMWAPDTFALGHGYDHNADVKGAYVASADYTITLASLATSSTRLVGRESTAIDNSTNKYLDYLIAGKVTTGTTPTVDKQIDLWAYGSLKDTPTYPGTITGTDSGVTLANAGTRNTGLRPVASALVTATSDVGYPFAPTSLTTLFGALMPPNRHGLWVTHDTAVNLNSTGSNHVLSYTPMYGTVA